MHLQMCGLHDNNNAPKTRQIATNFNKTYWENAKLRKKAFCGKSNQKLGMLSQSESQWNISGHVSVLTTEKMSVIFISLMIPLPNKKYDTPGVTSPSLTGTCQLFKLVVIHFKCCFIEILKSLINI